MRARKMVLYLKRSDFVKKKWYLQTWLICILFFFWFIYGIPLLIGIILLIIKTKNENQTINQLNELSDINARYEKLLTPEMRDAANLQAHIDDLKKEEDKVQNSISTLNASAEQIERTIKQKQNDLIVLDEEISIQEFGLYKPQFDFASALGYKEALTEIRSLQKELIKSKRAVSGVTNWQVNGSASAGRKMVSDTQKLLLRAFNNECDNVISKVRYTNFDTSLHRIEKSAEVISKLGTIMSISITRPYLDAKIKELRLAFEYRQKQQEEKEAAKAARAEQREQAKLQKEIEESKRKIEKEQNHYQTAYGKLVKQLQNDPDNKELLKKKEEFESKLSEIEKSLSDIDYRQANMRAGYVYVISNIGSFGENIYKIGMTRRLNPQDRVDELGDASVPFQFDVHAMIFSDDAPALEAALHKAFENKKLNMVNQRREFFNVSLDEIKKVIKENYDKTVEFIDIPDAEQFRISQKMRNF